MPKLIDLLGKRVGRLTVVKRAQNKNGVRWDCLCDCGNTTQIASGHLLNEATKSCGCLVTDGLDRVGQRFGRLLVISKAERRSNTQRWNCICDCGSKTVVFGNCFTNGNTTSCGCYAKEVTSIWATVHGGCGTKEYKTWEGMMCRVNNNRDKAYKDYGGRGISICERWFNFEIFLSDMGKRPEGMSLDRIDNDGDYSPENCRWATPKEQANNRRDNITLTFNETTKTIAEWAAETGLKWHTIKGRLNRGWSIKSTLTAPLFHREEK